MFRDLGVAAGCASILETGKPNLVREGMVASSLRRHWSFRSSTFVRVVFGDMTRPNQALQRTALTLCARHIVKTRTSISRPTLASRRSLSLGRWPMRTFVAVLALSSFLTSCSQPKSGPSADDLQPLLGKTVREVATAL